MKTPAKQTNSSKPYLQAIEELRGSVSGFEAARDSLKQAAVSLNKIVKAHDSISRSLGETENKLQKLMPEEFQKQLTQHYNEAATLLEAVSNHSQVVSEASDKATQVFMELQRTSHQHSRDLQMKIDSEAKELAENFARESREATTRVTADLQLALNGLSSDAAALTAQLETQQFSKDLDRFGLQLESAAKHISMASGSLDSSGEGFRILLEDSRSSVKAILDNLSRSETQIPRWGLYMLVAQAVTIVMLLIGLII